MQVILFQNIEKLGLQGDVVNVANGYFRNYLGPRGIAIAASDSNLSRLDEKRKKLKSEAEKQLNEAEIVAKHLGTVKLIYVMKATERGGLFGSVAAHDILEKLKEQGFANIERRQIMLAEPIKTLGTHTVKVKLHSHVGTNISVTIQPEGQAAEVAAPAEAPAEGEVQA